MQVQDTYSWTTVTGDILLSKWKRKEKKFPNTPMPDADEKRLG